MQIGLIAAAASFAFPSPLKSNSLKLIIDFVGVADGVTGAEWVSRVWH